MATNVIRQRFILAGNVANMTHVLPAPAATISTQKEKSW
jgi:hypothetical protein